MGKDEDFNSTGRNAWASESLADAIKEGNGALLIYT